jgi:hypothetical protein
MASLSASSAASQVVRLYRKISDQASVGLARNSLDGAMGLFPSPTPFIPRYDASLTERVDVPRPRHTMRRDTEPPIPGLRRAMAVQ